MLDIVSSTQLFDRIIDLKFYRLVKSDRSVGGKHLELVQQITTPRFGIKPKISFTWSRVPGNFCYNCQLQVTNLFVDWNIYELDSVTVTAGYSSKNGVKTCTFDCQIFDAYRPEPGPDGYCVFDCITATAAAGIFSKQPYDFLYYNTKYTVQQVLLEVQKKFNEGNAGLKFNLNCLSPGLLDTQWNDKSIEEEKFETGYGLLDYIKRHLSKLAEAKHGHNVFITLFNDTIYLEEMDKQGNPVFVDKNWKNSAQAVPILDQAKEVTWTAGKLSCKAPWNPEIYPGSVFYCNPAYYTGGHQLPNELIRKQAQRDKYDMYYVIMQTVSFSTTGNQNEMQLTAVQFMQSPAQNMLQADEASIEEAETVAKQLAEDAKTLSLAAIQIKIGDKEKAEPSELEKQVSKSMTVSSSGQDLPKGINTLSQFAQEYAEKYEIKAFKGTLVNTTTVITVPAFYFLFPLMAMCTSKADKKYNINRPDYIKREQKVYVPSNIVYKDFERDSKFISLLRQYADYYAHTAEPTRPQWGAQLILIADILEKGKVVQ